MKVYAEITLVVPVEVNEDDIYEADGIVFDMLFKALNWNGLGGLVFGDDDD